VFVTLTRNEVGMYLTQALAAIGIIILAILIGAIIFVLWRYRAMVPEMASEPLILKCGTCGKVVYTSRTGRQLMEFTSKQWCTACAAKTETRKALKAGRI